MNASTIRRRVELSSVEFSRVELCRYKRALMLFITVTLINERCVVLYCIVLNCNASFRHIAAVATTKLTTVYFSLWKLDHSSVNHSNVKSTSFIMHNIAVTRVWSNRLLSISWLAPGGNHIKDAVQTFNGFIGNQAMQRVVAHGCSFFFGLGINRFGNKSNILAICIKNVVKKN